MDGWTIAAYLGVAVTGTLLFLRLVAMEILRGEMAVRALDALLQRRRELEREAAADRKEDSGEIFTAHRAID